MSAAPAGAPARVTAAIHSKDPPGWAANCAFPPDAIRGARIDQAVREGLADSLNTIFESLDPPSPADARTRAGLLHRVRAGPVPPALFGAYVELVLALFAERDDEARALLDELSGSWQAQSESLRIITLDDRDLGQGRAMRYRRLLSDDIACEIEPLGPGAHAGAAEGLAQALDLLRAGAPDVFCELRALVTEIVLVAQGDGPQGFVFAGASTFSLWGALVLNADRFGDRLDVAVSLAHEWFDNAVS